MAFTYGFYNSLNGDRKYNAEQMAAVFDCLINDGVQQNIGDKLMVSPAVGSEGLLVTVGSGRAWFNSTWSFNDSAYPLVIDPVETTSYSRIDAVCLLVDKNTAVRKNSLVVLKGAASTSPSKPAIPVATNRYYHVLGYVTVVYNATAITATNIENRVGTSDCPFITGILETITVDELLKQWSGEFYDWWENLKTDLDGDIAANLQNQIDHLNVKESTLNDYGFTHVPEGKEDYTYVEYPVDAILKQVSILVGSVGTYIVDSETKKKINVKVSVESPGNMYGYSTVELTSFPTAGNYYNMQNYMIGFVTTKNYLVFAYRGSYTVEASKSGTIIIVSVNRKTGERASISSISAYNTSTSSATQISCSLVPVFGTDDYVAVSYRTNATDTGYNIISCSNGSKITFSSGYSYYITPIKLTSTFITIQPSGTSTTIYYNTSLTGSITSSYTFPYTVATILGVKDNDVYLGVQTTNGSNTVIVTIYKLSRSGNTFNYSEVAHSNLSVSVTSGSPNVQIYNLGMYYDTFYFGIKINSSGNSNYISSPANCIAYYNMETGENNLSVLKATYATATSDNAYNGMAYSSLYPVGCSGDYLYAVNSTVENNKYRYVVRHNIKTHQTETLSSTMASTNSKYSSFLLAVTNLYNKRNAALSVYYSWHSLISPPGIILISPDRYIDLDTLGTVSFCCGYSLGYPSYNSASSYTTPRMIAMSGAYVNATFCGEIENLNLIEPIGIESYQTQSTGGNFIYLGMVGPIIKSDGYVISAGEVD